MRVSRRSLRKGLVLVGCLCADPSPSASGLGLTLIAAGALLHFLSKAYLEQNRELITAGPYRRTRNPFYVANLVIDVGILFVIAQIGLAIVYLPIWALAYAAQIREEETHLRELFGPRFETYAAAVPRFFPLRRPLETAQATGRFDWANPSLIAGREYARLVGIALAPATIWAATTLRELRLELFDRAHGFELGLVLLCPAAWILKLALAETFRHPEKRLVPFAAGRSAQGVVSGLVLLPLLMARVSEGSPVRIAAVSALVIVAVVLAVSPFSGRRRVAIDVALGAGSLAVGAQGDVLWLAVLPALWFAILFLDEVGRVRLGSSVGTSGGGDWRYASRIAVGAVLGIMLLGVARVWVQ